MPTDQRDNSVFHVITEGRTYELLANDEASMNKYVHQLLMIAKVIVMIVRNPISVSPVYSKLSDWPNHACKQFNNPQTN